MTELSRLLKNYNNAYEAWRRHVYACTSCRPGFVTCDVTIVLALEANKCYAQYSTVSDTRKITYLRAEGIAPER